LLLALKRAQFLDMEGFESPTANDFLARLQMQTERTLKRFQQSKNEIDSMCCKSGMMHSSRRILLLLDAIDTHVEQGVAIVLGELRRAVTHPALAS